MFNRYARLLSIMLISMSVIAQPNPEKDPNVQTIEIDTFSDGQVGGELQILVDTIAKQVGLTQPVTLHNASNFAKEFGPTFKYDVAFIPNQKNEKRLYINKSWFESFSHEEQVAALTKSLDTMAQWDSIVAAAKKYQTKLVLLQGALTAVEIGLGIGVYNYLVGERPLSFKQKIKPAVISIIAMILSEFVILDPIMTSKRNTIQKKAELAGIDRCVATAEKFNCLDALLSYFAKIQEACKKEVSNAQMLHFYTSVTKAINHLHLHNSLKTSN